MRNKKMPKKPTILQKRAAKAIILNELSDKPKTNGQVLESIGYSKGISETPSMVLETQGFKKALAEIGLKQALIKKGIDANKIAEKINVLLEATTGENPDYNSIDKGLKHATAIYGIEDKDSKKESNIYNFILNPIFKEQIKPLEEALKEQFKNAKPIETNKETEKLMETFQEE